MRAACVSATVTRQYHQNSTQALDTVAAALRTKFVVCHTASDSNDHTTLPSASTAVTMPVLTWLTMMNDASPSAACNAATELALHSRGRRTIRRACAVAHIGAKQQRSRHLDVVA
jgi:hypothetical protein